MGYLNAFSYRVRRKFDEHLDLDPSGLSFLKYSLHYTLSKLKEKTTMHQRPLKQNLSGDTVNVAVKLTGGLGDLIIQARALRSLNEVCDRLRFYLCVPCIPQAQWVFALFPEVRRIHSLELFESLSEICDCSLHLNTFAFFDETDMDLEKIDKLSPKLLDVYSATRKHRRLWEVFMENHPILDGAFARQCISLGENRHTFLCRMMDLPPSDLHYDLPMNCITALQLHEKYPAYITLNTGFDNLFVIATSLATKCYPTASWEALVRTIKSEFPDIAVIQIGNRKSIPIPGTDLNLAGKTTLTESAGILKGSALHLDIEGGLVHVASALGIRSAVLFGPTSKEYFAYPQNINLRDESCQDCWWTTERWMECCPRKQERNECMHKLTPERVFQAIRPALERMRIPQGAAS